MNVIDELRGNRRCKAPARALHPRPEGRGFPRKLDKAAHQVFRAIHYGTVVTVATPVHVAQAS